MYGTSVVDFSATLVKFTNRLAIILGWKCKLYDAHHEIHNSNTKKSEHRGNTNKVIWLGLRYCMKRFKMDSPEGSITYFKGIYLTYQG